MRNLWAAAIVGGVVLGVRFAFTKPFTRSIGRLVPEPFWIYLFSILCGISGIVPQDAATFKFISSYVLPAAIFLMLVGSPVTELVRLGRNASIAMALAAGTMWVSMIGCHALFSHWLPADSWKGAGALLGTWIGGSANMVAVKEILGMPDGDLAPLIIVDTLLSYGWLALLLLGPAIQKKFDRNVSEEAAPARIENESTYRSVWPRWMPLVVAALVALVCATFGKAVAQAVPAVPATGWTLLLATVIAILGALTPLRSLERAGASNQGGIALYVVLAAIGARTELHAAATAPVYILFGIAVLLAHGVLLLFFCRLFRVPLYLAATASQANVGGAVSAPIVAEAYRPGSASVGVLMAVAGTLLGTWAGVAGGFTCRWIESLWGR